MVTCTVLALWHEETIDDEAAKILRKPSVDLPIPLDSGAAREVEILVDAFLERDDALGLAAPQIGINKRIIIFRTTHLKDKDWSKDAGNYDILINPRITQVRGEMVSATEGCLSCPDISIEVERYPEIKVRACNVHGRKINKRYTDFLARIVQHEMDHLEGKLIVDHDGAFYCPKNRVSFFERLLNEK